ncbi:MAG: hypothetical protein RIS94_2508 [Pseudomonadota bacterium]|jgi:hypothetical protein
MKVARRGFLAGGAVAALAGPVGSAATAAMRLTLVDCTLPRGTTAGAVPLQADLVRQWRDGLGAQVAARGGTALVRWDKAIVLAGLGREARLKTRMEPAGAGVFRVILD